MLSKAKKTQRNFETGEFLKENINIKYSVKVLKFHGNVWVTVYLDFLVLEIYQIMILNEKVLLKLQFKEIEKITLLMVTLKS